MKEYEEKDLELEYRLKGELTNLIEMKTSDIDYRLNMIGRTYTSDAARNQQTIMHLEERITKLEHFIEKIMPILPDEVKLFLEVSEN